MFANAIGDILQKFHGCRILVLGDATYGACCVDDFTAKALGADFLVHYGHSCLVPAPITTLPMLYVFVDIAFDPDHLIRCIDDNFSRQRIAVLGTVQFLSGIRAVKSALSEKVVVVVPQEMPLSGGEVLGCTSPKLEDVTAFVFVADGRFHLEACMIRNPGIPAYRYDPYSKQLTREHYDHTEMRKRRQNAMSRASGAKKVGIVLGTLGRQGSPAILKRLRALLTGRKVLVVLASELDPDLLTSFDVDAWIQIACPRLSIDWGHDYLPSSVPLLSPYEAFQAFEASSTSQPQDDYPMDFYSKAGGPWSNYYSPPDSAASS